MINNEKLFKNINKGKIIIHDDGNAEWTLGNMILLFDSGPVEITVQVCWKNRFRTLTHFHANYDEIEEIIKEINNPNKVVCVKSLLGIFGETFEVIDKTKMKKQNIFRH